MEMAAAGNMPTVGDMVWHHGYPHELIGLESRAEMNGEIPAIVVVAVFGNDNYEVRGLMRDLSWSEGDNAWFLPGRLLARDERVVHQAVVGAWPRPEQHMAARKYLDGVDLSAIPTDRLRDVVIERKLAALVDAALVKVTETEAGPPAVRVIDEDGMVSYLTSVIEHVALLRSLRKGD